MEGRENDISGLGVLHGGLMGNKREVLVPSYLTIKQTKTKSICSGGSGTLDPMTVKLITITDPTGGGVT